LQIKLEVGLKENKYIVVKIPFNIGNAASIPTA
jgi:hypothetical protein